MQTYALNRALVQLGIDSKVLDYNPSYYRKSRFKQPKKLFRDVFRIPEMVKGKKVFGHFLDQYVPMSESMYTNEDAIIQNLPKADAYLAGSDQIWNCRSLPNGFDDTFFLTFAPQTAKKIAYAASLAMPSIPDSQKERYFRNISSFDAVSVREESGVRLLKELGIPSVQNTIDPVFLLDRSEWDILAKDAPKHPREKYVLVYGYQQQKDVFQYAKKLADSLGTKVFNINTNLEDYWLRTDHYYWNASPNEFINLIKHAEAVVTNSFHGTAFSVLYNKPFHFFTVNNTTNSRILDLLAALHLDSRHVRDSKLLLNELDYNVANAEVERRRQSSLAFLKQALEQ